MHFSCTRLHKSCVRLRRLKVQRTRKGTHLNLAMEFGNWVENPELPPKNSEKYYRKCGFWRPDYLPRVARSAVLLVPGTGAALAIHVEIILWSDLMHFCITAIMITILVPVSGNVGILAFPHKNRLSSPRQFYKYMYDFFFTFLICLFHVSPWFPLSFRPFTE